MHPTIRKYGLKIIRAINATRAVFSFAKKSKTIYSPLPAAILKEYNKARPLGPRKKLCYAPDKAIYFGFDGMVTTCCINRNKLMGKYPDQQIAEIWNNDSYKTLREYISNNDLNYGCDLCKKLLLTHNFNGAVSNFFDHFSVKSYPRIMEFELDNSCNLSCIICDEKFSSAISLKAHKSPYDNSFVEQLVPYIPHLKLAKFYGGEPFLIPIYFKIWERMISINPGITILVQTNGTILNDKVKAALSKGKFNINISIDSLDKENFERIRKNASFETVMKNVAYFKTYCKEKGSYLGIIPTPNILNWYELPALTNWAGTIDSTIHFNTLIHPPELSIWNLPADELTKIYTYLSSVSINNNTKIEKENYQHYMHIVSQIKTHLTLKPSEINQKIRIDLCTIEKIKIDFLQKFESRLSLQNHLEKEKIMSFFSQVISSLKHIPDKDLLFVKLNEMPIERIVNETEKGDLNYLIKLSEKKIEDARAEYIIIDKKTE